MTLFNIIDVKTNSFCPSCASIFITPLFMSSDMLLIFILVCGFRTDFCVFLVLLLIPLVCKYEHKIHNKCYVIYEHLKENLEYFLSEHLQDPCKRHSILYRYTKMLFKLLIKCMNEEFLPDSSHPLQFYMSPAKKQGLNFSKACSSRCLCKFCHQCRCWHLIPLFDCLV